MFLIKPFSFIEGIEYLIKNKELEKAKNKFKSFEKDLLETILNFVRILELAEKSENIELRRKIKELINTIVIIGYIKDDEAIFCDVKEYRDDYVIQKKSRTERIVKILYPTESDKKLKTLDEIVDLFYRIEFLTCKKFNRDEFINNLKEIRKDAEDLMKKI